MIWQFESCGQGWEDTIVKQDQSDENQSEMKISLPSMPSLYIISFLFRACEEVHRVGGHVLDKKILQKLASKLFEKVWFFVDVLVYLISNLQRFLSFISESFLYLHDCFLAVHMVISVIVTVYQSFFDRIRSYI